MSEKEQKGLVGIKSNHEYIIAYSYADGLDIRCTAGKLQDNLWSVNLVSNGLTVLRASIIGGRWRAVTLCRFLRNGMVSRRMRKRKAKKPEGKSGPEAK